MTARLYNLNQSAVESKPKYCAGLKGQAKVVFDALSQDQTPRLATDVALSIESAGTMKTTQTVYRVTLYYILIFKSKGLITVTEPVRDTDDVETEENEFDSEVELN